MPARKGLKSHRKSFNNYATSETELAQERMRLTKAQRAKVESMDNGEPDRIKANPAYYLDTLKSVNNHSGWVMEDHVLGGDQAYQLWDAGYLDAKVKKINYDPDTRVWYPDAPLEATLFKMNAKGRAFLKTQSG